MKVSIQIVTYAWDFRYLVYALRSVSKFARDFEEVVICCPGTDQKALETMLIDLGKNWPSKIRMRPRYFAEWVGKGMLHHMFVILNADSCCPGADFVLHMDSDHIFTGSVSPETYVKGGKADIVYASFDWLTKADSEGKRRVELGLLNWQNASFRALGVMDEFEFMRRAPLVHARQVYPQVRADVEAHTGGALDVFMKDQRNTYPQTFAEFQSIGSVAYRKFRGFYNWHNQEAGQFPDGHIGQSWSHRPPTAEDLARYKELGIA